MRTSGWVVFASFMLVLAGTFSVIDGLIAVTTDTVIVAGEDQLVAFDLTQWGWIHIIVGAVVIAAGFGVASGQTWARVVGVIAAGVSALSTVAFIHVYPFWSFSIVIIDILIIYGLLVHGDEVERESQGQ